VASPALAASLAGRIRLRQQPGAGAEALLREHIELTCKAFEKRIVSWDVVNEAVDNLTGNMRETALSKAMGSPDQVLEFAFHAARAVLPDTELVYNDYMGWESDNAPHRDGVLRLAGAVSARTECRSTHWESRATSARQPGQQCQSRLRLA
jgi:GH35 family endo-1,4-beta-xylanase